MEAKSHQPKPIRARDGFAGLTRIGWRQLIDVLRAGGLMRVIQMTLCWNAVRITPVVLWDGEEAGDAPGGTAHMVQLARDAGTVRIRAINAKLVVMKRG